MKLGLGSSSSNLMKGAGNRYQRHRGQALPGLILSSKEADDLQDSYPSWFAMTWAMGTALARDIFFLSTENHHRGSRAPANGNLELGSKAASFSVVPHQLRDFRQVASLLCASFISQMRVLLPDLKGCLQTWNETEFWKLSWGHMLILLLSAHLSISSWKGLEFRYSSSWIQKHPVDSGTKFCPQLQKLSALGSSWVVEALDCMSASSLYLPCTLSLLLGPSGPHFHHRYDE